MEVVMRCAFGSARLVVALVVAVIVFACGDSLAGTAPPPGTRVGASEPRLTVAAPSSDVRSVVAGEAQLGLDLLRALVAAAPRANVVFSPYSVQAALAMAYGGSAGTTHEAFDRVLYVSLAETAWHRAMNDLDRQLTSRGRGASGTGGQPFRLDVTNQLFADRQATFVPVYLGLIAREYGAAAQLVDFRTGAEPARVAINGWVEQKTGGHIKDLLAPGVVTSDTRGVLVNAIYFDAAWAKKFEAALTGPAPFQLLDGTTASVPTMRSSNFSALAATVDGVEVVALPYDGRELSLLVLMPTRGSFADWERSLTAADLDRYAAARRPEQLTLSIPKFTVRTSARLTRPLQDLGLGVAFSPRADFSRMSATEPLLVSDVVHQALIVVDEAGTVAAAATAVGIGATSIPRTRTVAIDRPFVYLIRDEATGAVVFLGRYVGPRSG